MRLPVVILAASLLSGCTSTVLAEPGIYVSPYLAIYELRGETKMQSNGLNPGELKNNTRQALRNFGQDRFREDVGLRMDIGDGFGGLRGEYYRLDMDTARTGQLDADWGRLLAGDMVRMYAEMDEFRLGYIEPLMDVRTDYRDEELRLRLGAGAILANRTMILHGREDSNTRTQKAEINGDVIYLAVRAQAVWQEFTLDIDLAVASEDLVLSGDMEDFAQDLEVRLSYQLPQRDIQFFAGLRYSEFSASGDANGLRYDADLIIDGFQLGMRVTF